MMFSATPPSSTIFTRTAFVTLEVTETITKYSAFKLARAANQYHTTMHTKLHTTVKNLSQQDIAALCQQDTSALMKQWFGTTPAEHTSDLGIIGMHLRIVEPHPLTLVVRVVDTRRSSCTLYVAITPETVDRYTPVTVCSTCGFIGTSSHPCIPRDGDLTRGITFADIDWSKRAIVRANVHKPPSWFKMPATTTVVASTVPMTPFPVFCPGTAFGRFVNIWTRGRAHELVGGKTKMLTSPMIFYSCYTIVRNTIPLTASVITDTPWDSNGYGTILLRRPKNKGYRLLVSRATRIDNLPTQVLFFQIDAKLDGTSVSSIIGDRMLDVTVEMGPSASMYTQRVRRKAKFTDQYMHLSAEKLLEENIPNEPFTVGSEITDDLIATCPWVMKREKYCVRCGARSRTYCGKCQSVYYCSRDCQHAAWPIHKTECKRVKNTTVRMSEDGARILLSRDKK